MDPAAGVFEDDLEQPAIKGCGLVRVALELAQEHPQPLQFVDIVEITLHRPV